MLNQLLGGHYRVVQDLGKGGFAKTYIAEDHHRPGHPKCAVKFLKPASNAPDFLTTARRLFNQEAEILEKLGQHDQIPRLLAYFEENQEFYLVQEFIEGHPLSTELPRGQRWPESKVIQMLQDVLQILEFVHSYRVIHRDIKPSNLIRRQEDGRLVLIDFGVVKQIHALRVTTQMTLTHNTISIGTPGYVSLEQLGGKPRLSSDIYALGMIGIQALTGADLLSLQEDRYGEVIWQDRAEVSDQLAAILTKMVRYHFKDRYQSATEVLQALQPLVNHDILIQPTSKQATPEVAPEPELSATEVTLKLTPEVAPEPELSATEVTLKLTRELAPDEEEKISLASPTVILAPSEDLELSHGPISVLLNKSRLLMGVGITSVLLSIFAGYTYLTHRQSYLQAQGAKEQIEALKAAEKYQECVQQAQKFPQNYSHLHAEVETLLQSCQQDHAKGQMAEARKLAEQSRFKDAIALAAQVSANTDVHLQAQQLIYQWSDKIFQIANNQYQQGNFQEAIAIAGSVPNYSPLAKQAQATIQQWNEEWKQNQTHWQAALKALDERRWQDAINVAKKISNTAYWQKQVELIIQKAKAGVASAQATASRRTYKSRSRSLPRSKSVPRSKSLRRSRSPRRSRSTSRPSKSTSPPSRSISIPSRLTSTHSMSAPPPSSSTSSPSSSNNWICLNNPNPKCGR